ncbi:hypothetical protein C8R43DRAFT_955244 [Mycena crocata]|nr:hypothetical protein C8R43DRAFT_955244 [Mycena crocata]
MSPLGLQGSSRDRRQQFFTWLLETLSLRLDAKLRQECFGWERHKGDMEGASNENKKEKSDGGRKPAGVMPNMGHEHDLAAVGFGSDLFPLLSRVLPSTPVLYFFFHSYSDYDYDLWGLPHLKKTSSGCQRHLQKLLVHLKMANASVTNRSIAAKLPSLEDLSKCLVHAGAHHRFQRGLERRPMGLIKKAPTKAISKLRKAKEVPPNEKPDPGPTSATTHESIAGVCKHSAYTSRDLQWKVIQLELTEIKHEMTAHYLEELSFSTSPSSSATYVAAALSQDLAEPLHKLIVKALRFTTLCRLVSVPIPAPNITSRTIRMSVPALICIASQGAPPSCIRCLGGTKSYISGNSH